MNKCKLYWQTYSVSAAYIALKYQTETKKRRACSNIEDFFTFRLSKRNALQLQKMLFYSTVTHTFPLHIHQIPNKYHMLPRNTAILSVLHTGKAKNHLQDTLSPFCMLGGKIILN